MSFYAFLAQDFHFLPLDDQAAALLRLLARERSQRVLAAVAGRPGCDVPAVMEMTTMTQPEVSRVLGELRVAGLLTRRRGTATGAGRPRDVWWPAPSAAWDVLERAGRAIVPADND